MKEYKYKINGNVYNVVIGDIEDNLAHVEVNGTHYTVEMEKKAKDFSEQLSKDMAEAIYKFVKEIGINITIPPSITTPPAPPTLPGGPCSGAIPVSNITIS